MSKNPIFCAIDTSDIETAISLVDQVKSHIGGIKLGLEFFTSCGISGCYRLKEFDLPLFIDLKLYDIPSTVTSALRGIFSLEPQYTTLHISGGSEMLKSSVDLKNELQSKTNLLGVENDLLDLKLISDSFNFFSSASLIFILASICNFVGISSLNSSINNSDILFLIF